MRRRIVESWNRFYDPDTGRYISADPIGLDGNDANLYSYVWQDPINWSDSLGLFADEHTKGARPSTIGKHEKGKTRKIKDRGVEKGDKKRRVPRKKPKGWKGPWPPITTPSIYPLVILPWQIECANNPFSPKCSPNYCGQDQT